MDKLIKYFEECKQDLYNIGINLEEDCLIDIKLGRNNKRYGACKPESPYLDSKYMEKVGRRRYIKYGRYRKYHIEISPWVMQLDKDIIKNTIVHELIHCLPYCDNHGAKFKEYALYINKRLGLNVSRVGNKSEDYRKSNLKIAPESYKYKVVCKGCGQEFFRKRISKNFVRKYICKKCGRKI